MSKRSWRKGIVKVVVRRDCSDGTVKNVAHFHYEDFVKVTPSEDYFYDDECVIHFVYGEPLWCCMSQEEVLDLIQQKREEVEGEQH